MPPATTVYWAVSTVHTINVDKQYKYYDWNTNAMDEWLVCFISWPWFKVLRWLCVFSLMCRMSVVDARVHSYASGADDTKHQPRAKLCVLFFLSRRHWMPLIMCVLNQHNILAGSRCSGTLCATRYVRMCVQCIPAYRNHATTWAETHIVLYTWMKHFIKLHLIGIEWCALCSVHSA